MSSEDWGAALSRAVAPAVAHDGLRLVGTSPAAGFLPASCSFRHRYDSDLALALMRSSYAGGDPDSLPELARRSAPAVVVGTGGDGRCDPVEQRLLAVYGVGSELRLLLRDARGVWGTLELLRSQGGKPFDAGDLHRATLLGPSLVAFLRGYVTAGPLIPVAPALPAGVLIVGPDHTVRAATPQVQQWQTQLHRHQRAPDCFGTTHCAGLSLQARKHARDSRTQLPQVLAPAVSHGRWVTIAGQLLDGGGGAGEVAIIIQAATTEQLLPSFCDWYGITARERQVVEYLCAASAPKQIARRLGLSVHTVNDHLKAVFRKTGADGRDELIAAVSN